MDHSLNQLTVALQSIQYVRDANAVIASFEAAEEDSLEAKLRYKLTDDEKERRIEILQERVAKETETMNLKAEFEAKSEQTM